MTRRLLGGTEARLHHDVGNPVGVRVGGRAAVLEVAVALGADLAGNADRRATVCHAPGELVDGASLVTASQAKVVTLTVDGNVLLVPALKLLDGSLNELHATLLAHLLGGEVGVQTGAVPAGLELKHNKAGVSRVGSGGTGVPPSTPPSYATHAGPKPNSTIFSLGNYLIPIFRLQSQTTLLLIKKRLILLPIIFQMLIYIILNQ
jgi:hypothetical protein